MNLSTSHEQNLLSASLASFLRDQYPIAARTAASRSAIGWRPDIWRTLGRELGILGAAFPEAQGGSGGGPVETMLIMEQLGAALVLEPFLESVVMAGGLLRRLPGAAAGQALAAVLAGDDSIAVGWSEPQARFGLSQVATTARRDGDGWRLDGHKVAVVGAQWGRA
jgi:alkylation response protein AidB-like acyl-CoA dehydrogenase